MAFSWAALARPIRALAPMEDVTDTVFRQIIARCGRPDVFFSEFIHTDIVLAPRGNRLGITPRLRYGERERPLVAQIWGTDPDQHAAAGHRIRELGFDGIDINMGCPVRKIRKKGACSALIDNPSLAAEIIAATRDAGLPVSVKTRIAGSTDRTTRWMTHLLEQQIDALTVHGRTAAQESEGDADWDEIARIVAIRDSLAPQTAVLGNGDVSSPGELAGRAVETHVDGVMVGRGIFGNPYLFNTSGSAAETERISAYLHGDREARLGLLVRHIRLYRDVWGSERNYEILKKFYKMYLDGFEGSGELRDRLNDTHDYEHAERVIAEWRAGHP